MINKLLSFLKLRLIETIGIITILCSFIYIFTLANYSADNSMLVFTNQNINILFSNYLYSISDFLLQAFGITSFLIFGNLFFWGLLLIFKKRVTNFSFKIFFVTLYLIFGSLFLNYLATVVFGCQIMDMVAF